MERKPRRTIWSKKAKLLSTLLAVTLLCTTIIPGSVFAQDDVLETEPLVVETVESEEPAAEEQPAEEVTPVVEEEAPAATEETTEEQPVETEETAEEATESPVAAYVADLEGLLEEAKSLDAEAEDLESQCADIYDAAMAVYDEACTKWENDELTDDEMAQVEEATMEVWTYLETEYGYDPYDTETYAGPSWGGDDDSSSGGTSGGGESLDQSYWDNSMLVYYDTVNNANYGEASSNGGDGVTSVSLEGTSVTYGNAGNTSWSGGQALSAYYGSTTTTTNTTTATLNITAESGYYVTGVVVACAPKPNSQLSPFVCSTWSNGANYSETFKLTQSTYANGAYTLSTELSSLAFCHDSNDKGTENYFILILVAKVPSPLYVEYNYGNVTDFLTVDENSAFYNPTWTVKNSANDYGTGYVLTNDTQFAYVYDENDITTIEEWNHVANTVSDAALTEAANAGYYFVGWDVTWYNERTISEENDEFNNDYTLTFDDVYMTGSYDPGDNVQLPTNVRLVAQWEPIELKVTKTVEGLSAIEEFANESQTYEIVLQNLQSGNYVTLQTKDFVIEGDGTLTYSFAASGAEVTQVITPGTYKVVETGTYDLEGTTDNAYCTTTYPIQTVEVTADGTVKELKVLNTYSSTPATYNLTVQKTVTGNMGDYNKEFTFTVTYGGETKTFTLKHGDVNTIEGIPVGATVTVSENPDGYTYSFVSITEGVTKTDITNGVSFDMPSQNVTVEINNHNEGLIDTNVFLDNTPYILALGVVLASGTAMIFRRRKLNADK